MENRGWREKIKRESKKQSLKVHQIFSTVHIVSFGVKQICHVV